MPAELEEELGQQLEQGELELRAGCVARARAEGAGQPSARLCPLGASAQLLLQGWGIQSLTGCHKCPTAQEMSSPPVPGLVNSTSARSQPSSALEEATQGKCNAVTIN